MNERIASNNQLYVLNKHGRIQLLPIETTAPPVTSTQADEAIKASMAQTEDSADKGR